VQDYVAANVSGSADDEGTSHARTFYASGAKRLRIATWLTQFGQAWENVVNFRETYSLSFSVPT
jgi:hypothetical protein